MAHENLKFAFSFDRKNVWQPVAAEQSYGTFYTINIMVKETEIIFAPNGTKIFKCKCNFKLQNFVGAVTMGLSGTPQFKIPNNPEYSHLDIVMDVVPFNATFDLEDVVLEEEIIPESGMTLQVRFNVLAPPRNLYDPENLSKSAYINPASIIRDGDEYFEYSKRIKGSNEPFRDPDHGGGGDWGICSPNLSTIL